MRRILASSALSLVLASGVHAAELDINLSDETGEVTLSAPTDRYGMHNARAHVGVMFNDDDDIIGQVGLDSIGRVSESLRFHVGARGYLGDLDRPDETFSAIGIGGGLRLALATAIPVGLNLSGHFAPKVLSFSGAEGVRRYDALVDLQFAQNAGAYLGYSYMKVKLEDYRDVKVRDGVVVGVRLGF